MANPSGTATVLAARAGDPAAVDRLVADHLPLVYAVAGRALGGHADVDDVVQETMLKALRGLRDLRDPAAFRSWLVAITVRQVRDRHRSHRQAPGAPLPEDVHDPGPDFTDVTIARLELTGQRRETAEATRWLDADDREVLSLWWLEAAGELTRDDVVRALGVSRPHAAVRVQRTKGQLETARVVVRALAAAPACPGLAEVTATWDGQPSALWRKRVARHARGCPQCGVARHGLVPPERLLGAMALVPVGPVLATLGARLAESGAVHAGGAAAGGAAAGGAAAGGGAAGGAAGSSAAGASAAGAAGAGTSGGVLGVVAGVGTVGRVVAAVLVTGVVAGGTAVASGQATPDAPVAAAVVPTADPTTASVTPPPEQEVTPSPTAVPAPPPAPAPAAAPPPPEPPAPVPAEPPAPAPAAPSAKKGVATWDFPHTAGALDDVGASWFYNWSPSDDRTPGPADVEFVPMIWGRDAVTDATLAQARSEGDVLLGFNEPDLAEQSGMSVEEALDLWPRLEATGMRLGSPAVAWGGDAPGGWLDRFLTGARERGLRVDFVTLHWYGSDFSPAAVDHFLGYVDAVHARYGLPVWVTEYGLMNFSGSPRYPTGAQAAAFIAGTTQGMQARPYVERYAWFGLPAVGDSAEFGLYRDATTPTEAGVAYRAAGG